ncbi:Leucine-rich repeat [Sesbania bispinosa]|nr:Leucine-rich repeat [Sesbania bispinosa]
MVGFTSQISIILLLLLSSTTFHKSILCSTETRLRCNEKDRSALLTFKHGVVDRSNKLSSWSNEEDCCAWNRVHCDNITGRVTRLDLNQQYLEGEINLSLLEIEFLNYLDLSLNGFTALSLPPMLNQSLVTSNIHQINLQNETNWLQSMTMHSSLLELRLASCHLTDISPSIKHMNFTSLVTLDLSGNSFDSELPEWVFNLSNISHIDLSFNFLQGQIPKSLLSLQNLKSLRLNDNELNGSIPDWLGQHEHLQYLGLYENLFHGSIPSSLGNLSSLVDLSISSNFLTGNLPTSLGQLFNLKSLFIGGNLLSGAIPDCWEYWKGLSFLLMESNKLTGEVPPSMGSFIDLIIMDLHNNSLSGNFSVDLSNMTNLQFINIGGNNFSGIVPVKMPQSMEVMLLGSNKFEGNIPPQLCNLSSLIQLDLSHNKLSGPIPQCISKITGMGGANKTSHYPFEFNLYTKGQQYEFEDFGLLRTLDLSANNMSGEIPPEVFSLVQLQTLNFSRNHFTGKIPKEIGDMKNLESLDLSNNQISGEIPVTISTLTFLSFLNLSNNELVGPIPLGTQLQSFYESSYGGNPGLCGAPLPKNCVGEGNVNDESMQHGGNNDDFTKSLYLGMGVGFAVGFWGICGSIFLNRTWRHTYFRFLNYVKDQLLVFMAINFKSNNNFSGIRGTSN